MQQETERRHMIMDGTSNRKDDRVLDLDFSTQSRPLILIVVGVTILVVAAILIVGLAADSRGSASSSWVFLVTVFLVLMFMLWFERQFADRITFDVGLLSVNKRSGRVLIRLAQLRRARYMRFLAGFAHFWIRYEDASKLRTVYFILHTVEWPEKPVNNLTTLITELDLRTSTKEVLRIW